MSTTVTMWLGIVFVLLAIAAVLLQAWLWSYPFDHATHKSTAPRAWRMVHRLIGVAFIVIYVVMMVQMVPRLWSYQVELPARTVIHALLAVTIGVLVIVKISILRFFKHFESGAMPTLGLGIMLCTILMAFLSLPYSLRAHAYTGAVFEQKNLERTRGLLATLDFGKSIDVAAVTTVAALAKGQAVLTNKCVTCHDLRTVLIKPRDANGWLDVVDRMVDKPTLGLRITDEDVPYVTAYLVAITPDLQESTRRRRAGEKQQQTMAAQVAAATAAPVVAEVAFDAESVRPLYEKTCSQCHKLTQVEKHGPDDAAGWRTVVVAMVEENEAEFDGETATKVVQYLVATHGKK